MLSPQTSTERTGYRNISHPNDSPFTRAFSTNVSYFEQMKTDKMMAENFHSAMQGSQVGTRFALANSFPYNVLKSTDGKPKLCVDVGGGRGQAMILLKEIWPELDFKAVVQDLAGAFEGVGRHQAL
jgi:hypothetical protein